MKLNGQQLDRLKNFFAEKARTINETAQAMEIGPATVRKYIAEFVANGTVVVAGVTATGTRGRPSRLYCTSGTASTETVATTSQID
jgi:predicted ArsR family transcriptional regulator